MRNPRRFSVHPRRGAARRPGRGAAPGGRVRLRRGRAVRRDPDPEACAPTSTRPGWPCAAVHARPLGEDAARAPRHPDRRRGHGDRAVRAARSASPTPTRSRALARELNEGAPGGGHGLRFGYHNHDFELSRWSAGARGSRRSRTSSTRRVLLEVDTYWAAVGGQDVPELLGRLGDRVRYLHVKDGPVTKDDPMTAVGAGRCRSRRSSPPARRRSGTWSSSTAAPPTCSGRRRTASLAHRRAWPTAGPATVARRAQPVTAARPLGLAVVGCGNDQRRSTCAT